MRYFHRASFALTTLGLLCATLPAIAQIAPPSGDQPAGPLVTATVESSVKQIYLGESFLLAFRFEIAPHWHIYWKNPGGSGIQTGIEIIAPPGYEIGEIIWPRPQLIPGDPPTFPSYGYENEVTLLVPVKAPYRFPRSDASFVAKSSWLVCKETCLAGKADLRVGLVAVQQLPPAPPEVDEESSNDGCDCFADYRIENDAVREAMKSIPCDLAKDEDATIVHKDNRITLTGPAHGETSLTFFDSHSPGVASKVVEQSIENDQFTVVLEIEINESATLGEAPTASGVIALGDESADPSYSFEFSLDDE